MPAKGSTREDDKHRRDVYIQHRIAGVPPTQSARLAGYKNPIESSKDLERNPEITDIVSAEVQNARLESKYNREKVMDVLDRAINMAEMEADPASMIRGAQEINKMQGFYSPETKRIELSGEVQHRHDQIQAMSEDELLRRLGKEAAYIDAEFEEVPDDDA